MSALTRRSAVVLVILAATALACALPVAQPSPQPPPAQPEVTITSDNADAIATAVQATLQAGTLVATQPEETLTAPAATQLPETPVAATQRVAYIDPARNLWVWSDGGGVIQVADSGDVTMARISPDGEQVAYVRAANFFPASLWVVQRDGSGARQLLSSDDLNGMAHVQDALGNIPAQVEWVPGRDHLLALSTRPVFDGPGLALNEDLILVDTYSAARTDLLAPGAGGMFAFSPDGSQIALVKPEQIDLINSDGSNRRANVLHFAEVVTYSEYRFYAEAVWAADSSSLRVAIPPAKALDEPGQATTLWRLAVDGSPAVQVGSVTTASLIVPRFAPDLAHLAFLTDPNPGSGNFELYIAAADGSGAERYDNTTAQFSAWSRGADRFIYYQKDSQAARLGAVGAMAVDLTDSSVVKSPRFLKDGRVVFLSSNGAGWELRLASPAAPSALLASLAAGSNLPQFDVIP